MNTLQAEFGTAQTGLGYQFYDADGGYIGARVTTGIATLPGAGNYAVTVMIPEGAVGVIWTSTETPDGILDDELTDCEVAASSGGSSFPVGEGVPLSGPAPDTRNADLLEAGFGTLAQLKARILPAIMENHDGDGEWDRDFTQVGIAVAEQMNRHCNRVFQRGVNIYFDDEGGGYSRVLPRYPVESIAGAWLTSGSGRDEIGIESLGGSSGMVHFCGSLGNHRSRVTVQYTGGYWLGVLPPEFQSVAELVPGSETEITLAPPEGYLASQLTGISIKRRSGTGQLIQDAVTEVAGEIRVTFTSAPLTDGLFEVSARFEKPTEADFTGPRESKTATDMVPTGVTEMEITPPSGFCASQAVQASITRLTGDSELAVANFAEVNGKVVVTFDAATMEAGAFRVSVLFETEPLAAAPSGASELPRDLYEAWIMQCQASIEHLNTLRGAGVQTSAENVGKLADLAMLPAVKSILTPYRRYA